MSTQFDSPHQVKITALFGYCRGFRAAVEAGEISQERAEEIQGNPDLILEKVPDSVLSGMGGGTTDEVYDIKGPNGEFWGRFAVGRFRDGYDFWIINSETGHAVRQ